MTIQQIRSLLVPASAALCLLASMVIGVYIHDAANPMMMLPIAILGCWVLMSGRLLKVSLQDGALLGLMLLWLFWGISGIFSEYPFNSKVTWIIMGVLPVSYLFWRTANFDERWIKGICGLFIAGGVALAIWAILQVTLYKATAKWSGRADHPYADPNMLGVHLSLTLLPIIPLIIKPVTARPVRILLTVSALILIAGMFATYSRSAMVGTAAGAGLILLLMRNQIIWTRNKLIALAVTIAAGVAAFIASGMAARFIRITWEGGDPDVNGRLSLWKTAFEMSMNRPLTGYGFGTFSSYYPMFREKADATSAGWWVHMDPLQWAVESGWQTPLVFYLIVAYVVVRVWQDHKARTLTAVQAGCAAGLLSLFLNAHSSYPMHVAAFMIMATGMMVALLPVPAVATSTKRHYVFALSILAALTVICWSGIKTGATLYLWQDIGKARAMQDEGRYKSSLITCIERGDPQFAYCKFTMIEMMLGSSLRDDAKFKALIEESRKNNPYLPQPDFYMGSYYLKGGEAQLGRAIESFEQAIQKNPTFWPARKSLVTALRQSGRLFDALKVLQKGSDYPVPRSEVSFYNQTYKELRLDVYGKE